MICVYICWPAAVVYVSMYVCRNGLTSEASSKSSMSRLSRSSVLRVAAVGRQSKRGCDLHQGIGMW